MNVEGLFLCVDEVETRMDLQAGIALLPDRQRAVLNLYIDGYTQAEIGQRMGISQPAVSGLIQRAIQTIKHSFM